MFNCYVWLPEEIIKLTTCSQYIIDNKGIIWNNTNSQIGPAVLGLEDLGKPFLPLHAGDSQGLSFPTSWGETRKLTGFSSLFLRGMETPKDAAKMGVLGWRISRYFQYVDVTSLKPMDITNDQRLDCTNWNHHGSVDPMRLFASRKSCKNDAVYALINCTFQPVLDTIGML
jgi:hypothetical protein